ncbi:MAG: type I restriction enzyme HsdR N-terminal domain-containing protein, partial [Flavobacteriales bacterium]
MLTPAKYSKLQAAIKVYCKTYLHGKYTDLDESGTRLMINSFLTNVLGFVPIEEVKTEYMIRGTYADYVIQLGGKRHFLVEVKALSIALSQKHLRQATHYGADEGIDWALLTNGKAFEVYRILFNKPIEARRVFSLDLTNIDHIKQSANLLQYLHKDSVSHKGLDVLWNRTQALDPKCIGGLLYSPTVVSFLRRTLKEKYKAKFSEEDVEAALTRLVAHAIPLEEIKPNRAKKERAKR